MGDKMLKHVASVLLLTLAVRSDSSFIFPDEVYTKYNSGSRYDEDARGNRPLSYDRNHDQRYSGNYYHGDNDRVLPAFGHHHGYDNRPVRPDFPDYGGIFSQSQANAQASGSGSSANSHSGSQSFDKGSQSSAQAQAQSQGYHQGYQGYQGYPVGPSGGSGASSASSAASATSGIINGVAVSSASAAAANTGHGEGGASSVSASSSSSSGIPGGFVTRPDHIPPWYFRTRIAGEDTDKGNDDASGGHVNETTIVFSVK